MEHELAQTVSILRATPEALRGLLAGLPDRLLDANEGEGTWSPRQVMEHLIWAEIDDWIPRARMIRQHGVTQTFQPFDREEGFRRFSEWPIGKLLDEFARHRAASLATLDNLALQPRDLAAEGMHPAFGRVTLGQLLATWAAHDLGHVVQISRTLAKGLAPHVGPWREYLSVVR